jgi:benzoyl-CoA 2,3-dioxygenase component A
MSRAMVEPAPIARQHLIDPEICIRCNTCEDICPERAISHDGRNYVVDFDRCRGRGDCLPPCPTGAIDSWRHVARPWSVAEQLGWERLPNQDEPAPLLAADQARPAEVESIRGAPKASQGATRPPWSAAHPYVNLYTPARPAVATVVGNHRLTAAEVPGAIHHLVLDLGRTALPVLEGQSIGVLPPGRDARGEPHHVRLYSLASPRDGERPGRNNLALTVKRVVEDHEGRPVRGVASNYLCDLHKGDQVQIVGPYGQSFLMPNEPGASLLMICTGTGAAPMRAMTERRRRRRDRGEGGRLMLFFGARTAEELPYFGPLMRLPKDFIDVNLALSRVPGQPKRYVQDLLRERASAVRELISDERGHVYVCGLRGMEAGVDAALADVCHRGGVDFAALRARLVDEGRYHVETY